MQKIVTLIPLFYEKYIEVTLIVMLMEKINLPTYRN